MLKTAERILKNKLINYYFAANFHCLKYAVRDLSSLHLSICSVQVVMIEALFLQRPMVQILG